MVLIKNGLIVTEHEILNGYNLILRDDRIAEIAVSSNASEGLEVIDAHGGYICPGFIDIHSDYIEHMATPRPMCLMDFDLSIHEIEKELASHGITTIFHSLSLYNNWDFAHNPIRDPHNVRRFAEIIANTRDRSHLIRHRFHARLEIDSIEEVDRLMKLIDDEKVHLISFMDHTPGQGQYNDLSVYRKTIKSYNNQLGDHDIDHMLEKHRQKKVLSIQEMKDLAEYASKHHITVASHDDDTIEKLNQNHYIGIKISEFPTTLSIALQAKQLGFSTLGGAPNILLGGSHSGNLSASEAIQHNALDILCSDYYPPSLLHAIFKMNQNSPNLLNKMFNMLTINPAKAVQMDKEIGSIEVGKKADLLIIEKIKTDFPVITKVFVDGCLIQQMNYR
jgi:alpha-D-ribose 1-methylphosphonate 5-triphosphate diphosphatase